LCVAANPPPSRAEVIDSTEAREWERRGSRFHRYPARHALEEGALEAEFVAAAEAAGVVGKSAHGMRKAAATRAAENGATERELEAIFGWSGGRMATLYTKSANRGRLAAGAIGKLDRAETENRTIYSRTYG